jgi:hypothetical protein
MITFILIILVAICWIIGIIVKLGREEKKPIPHHHWSFTCGTSSIYATQQPPVVPTNALLGAQELGRYVEHSRRTGANVQIVDKVDIANGTLTAEHHVKITQHIAQPVQACISHVPGSLAPEKREEFLEYLRNFRSRLK